MEIGNEKGEEVGRQETEKSEQAHIQVAEMLLNPILYTRGVESDSFNLILGGKVMICSGNEGFMISQTSFNYMGVEAMNNDDYVPDFSAKVIDNARILKITRKQYRKALTSLSQKQSIMTVSKTASKIS